MPRAPEIPNSLILHVGKFVFDYYLMECLSRVSVGWKEILGGGDGHESQDGGVFTIYNILAWGISKKH